MEGVPVTCDSEDVDEKSLEPSEDSKFEIIEEAHDVEKEETKDMNIKVVSGSSFHDSSTPLQTIPDLSQEATTPPDNKDEFPAIGEKDDPRDKGNFTIYEVCLALYYGSLDDRRMKRLKEGFLQLFNQTWKFTIARILAKWEKEGEWAEAEMNGLSNYSVWSSHFLPWRSSRRETPLEHDFRDQWRPLASRRSSSSGT